MKVRFYDVPEDGVVYAQVQDQKWGNYHLTDGVNLSEAVYMALDLIALLKDEVEDYDPAEDSLELALKDMEEVEVASSTYIGMLDLDAETRRTGYVIYPNPREGGPREVDINYQWVRAGNKFPASQYYHSRWNALAKAYQLLKFELLDEKK